MEAPSHKDLDGAAADAPLAEPDAGQAATPSATHVEDPPALSPEEAENRMRQAARILASGALRAALAAKRKARAAE